MTDLKRKISKYIIYFDSEKDYHKSVRKTVNHIFSKQLNSEKRKWIAVVLFTNLVYIGILFWHGVLK